MALSFIELKELIHLGQELGLQQLQTENLVVVYDTRAVLPAASQSITEATDSDSDSITKMYASIGKNQLRR